MAALVLAAEGSLAAAWHLPTARCLTLRHRGWDHSAARQIKGA